MKLCFKRIGAYLIDAILVTTIVTMISLIPIFNPMREQYSEKYNELVQLEEQLLQNEINEEELQQALIPLTYELHRLNIYYVIIDIIVVLIYYVGLQYTLKGQTLGKKLLKIRVVGVDDEPVSLFRCGLRAIVLNNILISICLQAVVFIYKPDNYYIVYNNINIIGMVLIYASLFLILVRKDMRGLHDFVAGTKVIDVTEEKLEEPKKKESPSAN